LHPQSTLKVSPFCHEHPEGAHEVRGWCLDTPGSAKSSCLPINCSMFDGVSIVKCECSESEILDFLSNPQDTRRRLGEAISRIMQFTVLDETKHLRASWKRCRPTPNGTPQSLCSAVVTNTSEQPSSRVTFYNTQECVPLIDSEHWIPELSPEGFIGLYHNWDQGPLLYIICQSYLPKACLEFAEMVRNLGDSCTASDIYHSEEAHWLRQACARNRGRLIAAVCQQMKIKFPAMLDYNACKTGLVRSDVSWMKRNLLAISTVETLHHDLQSIPLKAFPTHHQNDVEKELIRVQNFSTTFSDHKHHTQHQAACIMAPWDGVWVFKDDIHRSTAFFPTLAPQITEQDHNTFKKKKMTHHYSPSSSFFNFSSNIPETSEILNIFYLKKEKSKKKSGGTKRPKSTATNVADVLSTIQEMHVVIPAMEKQNLETLKQMLMLSPPAPTTLPNQGDEDIMKAYERSISKMTSLILNNTSTCMGSSYNDKEEGLEQRGPVRKTYLAFDEHVIQAMEKQGWKRSRQFHTVLIPLACGLCEHWKQFNESEPVT
jgi:hypothetical protein